MAKIFFRTSAVILIAFAGFMTTIGSGGGSEDSLNPDDPIDPNSTNTRPVASPLSLQVEGSSPNLEINLIGSDVDGDTLQYELLSPNSGSGYLSASVDAFTGKLMITLDANIGETILLAYRVTDGFWFSESAEVVLSVVETVDEFGLGMLPIDPRTYASFEVGNLSSGLFGAPGQAPTLPPRIDLSDNFPPAGNQGEQGSCTAWATAYALKSYQERMEIGWSLTTSDGHFDPNHVFSPAFIYNQINQGRDGGSLPSEALQLIVDRGAATWATMPYDPSDYRSQPSSLAFQEAANFKAAEMKVADDTQAIKTALANRLPVVAGIFVYKSLYQLRGTNPVYQLADVSCSPDNSCGHAVTIVGYDDDKYGGAFKIINSWGSDWGDEGYFWLPYQFARQPAPWPNGRGPVLALSLYLEDADNTGSITPTPPPTPTGNLPNLEVEDWTLSYDPQPGGEGELEYKIINTGNAVASAGVDVNLMLSKDSTISSNDTYVVYESIPFEIEVGGRALRNQDNPILFNFPENLTSGVYYIAVWVDDLNVVAESNEEDNFSLGDSTVAIEDTLPDLVVRRWYAEWDDAGNGLLEYEIGNEGVSPTTVTNWDINLVLSPDEIIGNDNELYLFFEKGEFILEPGRFVSRDETNQAVFNLYQDTVGDTIPSGTYYMALWVDDLNKEKESDESNNYSLGGDIVVVGSSAFSHSSEKKSAYNGKPLPNQVAWHKVLITQDADEKHRVAFGKVGKRRFSLLEKGQVEKTYAKQLRSGNQVIFPSSNSIPMPKGEDRVQQGNK
jgi:hypothetical protein